MIFPAKAALMVATFLLWGGPTSTVAADKPLVVNLWPGQAPGESKPVGDEKYLPSKPEERCQKKLTNVSTPTITVYRPAETPANGAAVIVAPGGGYSILAEDLEGEEVVAWLNSQGITAVLLKYRVPRRPGQPADRPPPGALQDAQRALSLTRSNSSAWGIDPARIGLLGFSAGGHLTAWAATNSDKRAYDPVDTSDKTSCRPDFAVLVYPAYLQDKQKPDTLSPEIRVSSTTPPFFLAHAFDDPISVENSLVFGRAMKQAGVPVDLHIYARGGHGFGLRPEGTPCSTWPARCVEWMKNTGIVGKAK